MMNCGQFPAATAAFAVPVACFHIDFTSDFTSVENCSSLRVW